jgi:uncharacterized protein (DUF1778 family)
MAKPYVHVGFRTKPGTKTQFQVAASLLGVSMSQFVERAATKDALATLRQLLPPDEQQQKPSGEESAQ